MSQVIIQPKTRQFHHILIIDDSARLRQNLAELIVANCLAAGKIYRVFHSDKDGKFTQSNELPNPGMLLLGDNGPAESQDMDEFAIYTAPSPKQALFVINSPLFSRLTIISDVMMPADTEVGLIGMLEAIVRRSLPVNLVFASTDAQNIFVVAKLVEAGKAYFLVKQGSAWEDLSRALVRRTDNFSFKTITSLDFEGMQKLAGLVTRKAPEPAPEPEILQVEIIPDYSSFLPQPTPVQRPKIKPVRPSQPPVIVEPAPVQSPIFAAEPARPSVQTPAPAPVQAQAHFPAAKPAPALLPVDEPEQMQVPFSKPEPARQAESPRRTNAAPPMPTWEDLTSSNAPEPDVAEEDFINPTTEEATLAWEDLITPRTRERHMGTHSAQASAQPQVSQVSFKPQPPAKAVSLPSQSFAQSLRPAPKQVFPLLRPFVALLQAFKRN